MTGDAYVTVTRTQGNNRALKDGRVRPHSFAFEFLEVDPLIAAFRRMVRAVEFDICEMAITTYITARQFGKPFTALPIFLVRGFHGGAFSYNTQSGITSPKDLEGKKVGVRRGYTVTTGVWARGILERDYGVDLNRITWVLDGDEHVAEYRPPSNVVSVEEEKTLAQMLVSGEIAAAIGVEADHPNIKPLFPDATEIGLRALRERGEYPINHLIVVKDDLLNARAGVGPEIFEAFAEAKHLYVDDLKHGRIANPTTTDDLYRRVGEITKDPLPYGVEPNRATIEQLLAHAVSQHIITGPLEVEDLFAANTLGLIA